MRTCIECLTQYSHNEVSHVVRSWIGDWTIFLKPRGRERNRSISSSYPIEQGEIDQLKNKGFIVFDFKDLPKDSFNALSKVREDLMVREVY